MGLESPLPICGDGLQTQGPLGRLTHDGTWLDSDQQATALSSLEQQEVLLSAKDMRWRQGAGR